MIELPIVALVFVGLWLGLLTFVVVLLVRQLGLITVRLENLDAQSAALPSLGPEIGTPIVPEIATLLPNQLSGPVPILFISSNCEPCRELIVDIRKQQVQVPGIVLLTGNDAAAENLAGLLPPSLQVVRDPVASQLTEALQVRMKPFVVMVTENRVSYRSILNQAAELNRLVAQGQGMAEPLPRVLDTSIS